MQIDPPDLSITRLEKLFWEGMSISNTLGRKSSYYSPSAATAEDIEEEPVPFKYSISQHYTHSCKCCWFYLSLLHVELRPKA